VVFVPLSCHGRAGGPFGSLSKTTEQDIKSKLAKLGKRCRRATDKALSAFIGVEPNFDRLRGGLASILELDVIYQPQEGWIPVHPAGTACPLSVEQTKRKRLKKNQPYICTCKRYKSHYAWGKNPVWVHAPPGAYTKSKLLCSYLGPLVRSLHLGCNTHDLVQLSKHFWTWTVQTVKSVLRRMARRAHQSARADFASRFEKPEAEECMKTPTSNPGFDPCVTWYSARKGRVYRPVRYIPPAKRGIHARGRIRAIG